MAKDNNGVAVNVGDKIEIAAQGIIVRGIVVSADWYDSAGWYIEVDNANVDGGYSYWKQREDGGRITKVNDVKIEI